jgi:hypothetical protein
MCRDYARTKLLWCTSREPVGDRTRTLIGRIGRRLADGQAPGPIDLEGWPAAEASRLEALGAAGRIARQIEDWSSARPAGAPDRPGPDQARALVAPTPAPGRWALRP